MSVPPTGRGREEVLDREMERFDRFATALVHVEPCTLGELRRAVERFSLFLGRHLDAERRRRPQAGSSPAEPVTRRLQLEHDRFRSSLEQLRELLAVVEQDDHGGHRQALGQYGRILVEALRIHRADERRGGGPPAPGAAPARVGQP
jgi:hypothetical protein